MPVPMDEYPIHQLPLSLEYVGTGDRNFYDRCYFAGHDRTGDILLITGLGVYPNLGVTDAVEADLDELGVGTVHVLGDSIGARVALELAARGRARSVVAISPSGLNTPAERAYQAVLMGGNRLALLIFQHHNRRLRVYVAAKIFAEQVAIGT